MKTIMYKMVFLLLSLVLLEACSSGIKYVRTGKNRAATQIISTRIHTGSSLAREHTQTVEATDDVAVLEAAELAEVPPAKVTKIPVKKQTKFLRPDNISPTSPEAFDKVESQTEKVKPTHNTIKQFVKKQEKKHILGLIGFLISLAVTIALIALIVALGVITWQIGLGAFVVFLLVLIILL